MYSGVYFCLDHIMSPINPFFFSMNYKESPIFDVSNSAPVFFLLIVIFWYCWPVEVGSFLPFGRVLAPSKRWLAFWHFFLPSTVRRSKSRIASKQMAEAMAQYLWHSFLGWCSRWSYKSRFHPVLNTVVNQMWCCFSIYLLKAYSSCFFSNRFALSCCCFISEI